MGVTSNNSFAVARVRTVYISARRGRRHESRASRRQPVSIELSVGGFPIWDNAPILSYLGSTFPTTIIMASPSGASSDEARIRVKTRHVPPFDSSLPALAVQVTQLVDSYMLWVGTTDESAGDVEKAPLQGYLSKDWACAMPARDVSLMLETEIC